MNTDVPAGVGVDIVELKRFREIRCLSRVAELILAPTEYKRFLDHADQVAFLASRFALKEAVIKAVPSSLTYHDVEIINVEKKPYARLLNHRSKQHRLFVSLSHSTDYVAGFALAF